MAGQALGGLAATNPQASLAQKAGAALSGFGGGFSRSVVPMGQNMLLVGTVGTLGGVGAGRSASAMNRAIELKMPKETARSIVSYRAGALITELKLPTEVKAHIGAYLGAGGFHEEVRKLDTQYHYDMTLFRSKLKAMIDDLTGRR